MALPPRGTLTGDLGDALGAAPAGAGTLWLTPPTVVAYAAQGFTLLPQPIAVPVSADGTVSTLVARTDLGNPAGWAYMAVAQVPGLPTAPFGLVVVASTQDLAAGIVAAPGVPEWVPTVSPHAHDSLYPSRTEMQDAIEAITGVDVSTMVTTMGALSNGADLDTLTTAGIYPIPYSANPTTYVIAHDPGTTVGSLWTIDHRNSTGNVRTQIRWEQAGAVMWVRSSNTAGAWSAWRQVAHDRADRQVLSAARRDVVVNHGIARRGGSIGTGGRGVIALRYDHHTGPWLTKVLPLLKQHQLPWGQMLNASNLGSTGTETGTAAQMQTACMESGGEAWNHSWSHSDVILDTQADREVTRGLDDLRAALPRLWIDGWAQPGQTSYMGMEVQSDDRWWSTEPGRRVMAQHAFVRGTTLGVHRRLMGPGLSVAPHITIDAQTLSYVQSAVDAARDSRSGLTLMLHSNYLDQAGYMTTATLSSILAYVAARRDAGEIEVCSPTGVLMADAERPRGSMLDIPIEAGTIAAGGWTRVVSSRSYLPLLGVPHELGATLSGSGSATLTITIDTPSGTVTSTRTRTLTATPTRHVVVATPPTDTTGITVAVAAPNAQHLGITYRPI